MKKTRKPELKVVKPEPQPTKLLCARCGVTTDGVKIDWTTSLSVSEDYTWHLCVPCLDATRDSKLSLTEWKMAREDEMAANEKSYVRNFFQMKAKLRAQRIANGEASK